MIPYLAWYNEAAIIDFEEAVNYYSEQQNGLGERFANAVLEAVQSIETNPQN